MALVSHWNVMLHKASKSKKVGLTLSFHIGKITPPTLEV